MKPIFAAAFAALFLFDAGVAAAPRPAGPDVLFAQGQFDAAAAEYQAVPKGSQGYEPALRQLGAIALFRNHPEEAETMLRKALALNPGDGRSTGLLAEALNREGRFAEMAQLLRQIGRPERAAEFELFGKNQPYRVRGKAAPTTIPFEQTNPLPAVMVKVNDLEGLFLIDTGAPEIVLDPEYAREAQVATTAGSRGAAAGVASSGVSFARVARFGLQGLEVDDVPAMLLGMSGFSSLARGKHVAGVIGTSFLSHFRATLDYVHDRLILEPRDAQVRSGPVVAEAPFLFVGDHFLLAQGRLNKAPKQFFLVDTGLAPYAFTAPESTLREAGIAVPALQSSRSGRTVGPPAARFPIANLSLGSLEEKNLSGVFGRFPPPLELALGVRLGGIVSHAYFLPYSVTFDFVRMKIEFRK
ncbi:MAG TPA: aspartyl protease family protein [Rhizomicrobium sp.]|jgi:predicted aspartyl protease